MERNADFSLRASVHGASLDWAASPVIGVLESQWDVGSSAMEARILRPLVWFGLLES